MGKNKLIALVTSAVLIAGGVGVTALASNKTNNVTTKVENHVLLSAPATSNQAVVINTNKSPLVLYSAPNASSSVASYLSIGEMLTYQTTNNANFYKVTVQETGATGYISANNIQIIESGLNQAFNDMSGQGQVINVTRNVILRSQPDMQGSIMGNYKNNMPITLLGKQGQWYKVTIGGQTGYMYQEYVGIDNNNVTTNSSIRPINKVLTNNKINSGQNINNIKKDNNIISNQILTQTAYNNLYNNLKVKINSIIRSKFKSNDIKDITNNYLTKYFSPIAAVNMSNISIEELNQGIYNLNYNISSQIPNPSNPNKMPFSIPLNIYNSSAKGYLIITISK